ncbi:hypothetical protein FA15DRAFT_656801 [Coprinopsis marcescibilis]|uniref:FMR1-interacting protein 1 conserved domain-containing protein n=1 Tax=Coprinopsis marcescibilis TaxID=230819 RepID=A0A5C3KS88_COPMA|nr:hypothetical protein FA15DRAFT_656801 [Coprinopsis marcescibilis]
MRLWAVAICLASLLLKASAHQPPLGGSLEALEAREPAARLGGAKPPSNLPVRNGRGSPQRLATPRAAGLPNIIPIVSPKVRTQLPIPKAGSQRGSPPKRGNRNPQSPRRAASRSRASAAIKPNSRPKTRRKGPLNALAATRGRTTALGARKNTNRAPSIRSRGNKARGLSRKKGGQPVVRQRRAPAQGIRSTKQKVASSGRSGIKAASKSSRKRPGAPSKPRAQANSLSRTRGSPLSRNCRVSNLGKSKGQRKSKASTSRRSKPTAPSRGRAATAKGTRVSRKGRLSPNGGAKSRTKPFSPKRRIQPKWGARTKSGYPARRPKAKPQRPGRTKVTKPQSGRQIRLPGKGQRRTANRQSRHKQQKPTRKLGKASPRRPTGARTRSTLDAPRQREEIGCKHSQDSQESVQVAGQQQVEVDNQLEPDRAPKPLRIHDIVQPGMDDRLGEDAVQPCVTLLHARHRGESASQVGLKEGQVEGEWDSGYPAWHAHRPFASQESWCIRGDRARSLHGSTSGLAPSTRRPPRGQISTARSKSGVSGVRSQGIGGGTPRASAVCKRSDSSCPIPTTADGWVEYTNDPNWLTRLADSMDATTHNALSFNQASTSQNQQFQSANNALQGENTPYAPTGQQPGIPALNLQQQTTGPVNLQSQAMSSNPWSSLGGSSSLGNAMGDFQYSGQRPRPPPTTFQNTKNDNLFPNQNPAHMQNVPVPLSAPQAVISSHQFVQGSSSGANQRIQNIAEPLTEPQAGSSPPQFDQVSSSNPNEREVSAQAKWVKRLKATDPEFRKEYNAKARDWERRKTQKLRDEAAARGEPIAVRVPRNRLETAAASGGYRNRLKEAAAAGEPAAIAKFEELKNKDRERAKRNRPQRTQREKAERERLREQSSDADTGPPPDPPEAFEFTFRFPSPGAGGGAGGAVAARGTFPDEED